MSGGYGTIEGDVDEGRRPENGNTPIGRSRIFAPIWRRGRVVGRVGYKVGSDAIVVDGRTWISVCDLIRREGSDVSWEAFWTLNRLPGSLEDVKEERGERAEVIIVDVAQTKSREWVRNHLRRSSKAVAFGAGEVASKGSVTGDANARKVSRRVREINEITAEITDLDSGYLQTQMRVVVKASSRDVLDRVVTGLNRQYHDSFGGALRLVPRTGVQRSELRDLIGAQPQDMAGSGHWFTTREYGGAYGLVTHGIRDKGGEYVGRLYSDYNTSAVFVDLSDLPETSVVAVRGSARPKQAWAAAHPRHRDAHVGLSHLWGAKIAQSALMAGRRVVQFALDGTDVTRIGMPLSGLTVRVDLSQGRINPFELFDTDLPGDGGRTAAERAQAHRANRPALFSAQLDKLTVLTRLLAEGDMDAQDSAGLSSVLTDFYVGNRMYVRDAAHHLDELRLTTTNHAQVPTLAVFQTYLSSAAQEQRMAGGSDAASALGRLRAIFSRLLDKDGNLFNCTTSPSLDRAAVSRRAVYDFASLRQRGDEVALAQLVNVFGYAVSSLGRGDVIILHGAELLSGSPVAVDYILRQRDALARRGVHVVFIYPEGPAAAVRDQEINGIGTAGLTILGRMSAKTADEYESLIATDLTKDLRNLIVRTDEPGLVYLHRDPGQDALFVQDLLLGYAPARSVSRTGVIGPQAEAAIVPYEAVRER